MKLPMADLLCDVLIAGLADEREGKQKHIRTSVAQGPQSVVVLLTCTQKKCPGEHQGRDQRMDNLDCPKSLLAGSGEVKARPQLFQKG